MPTTETLTILNARAQIFDPVEGVTGFVTGGLAFGTGLDRTFSPIIGVGVGRWTEVTKGIVSWRAEVQSFRGGAMHYRRQSRLVITAAIGIP